MKRLRSIIAIASLTGATSMHAQLAALDNLQDSLHVESSTGFWRADFSGLLDLEEYYIDQRPPGLLFNNGPSFFNPRLSLFLDTHLGSHLYGFVQFRADRGFDPGGRVRDARFDEYFVRYTVFEDSRLNFQAGKFATVVGNWVARHDSWNNPFITAPLPYENVLAVSDISIPASPGAFLGRQNLPDNKAKWLTIIWGPSYASGASISGQIDRLDYAVEVKNAGLSSRPYVWDPTAEQWDNPTVSGRLGYRPDEAWNVGSSFSYGPYLLPEAYDSLPAGTSVSDFNQLTVGQDVSFSWHEWQVWAEAYASRFDVPNVGNADTLAYYVEAKYKISSELFAAARWNQQFFGTVPNGLGGRQQWDPNMIRVDAALGWRLSRSLQFKAQYSYGHRQEAVRQQGAQMVAGQATWKF
jgi:hypothetical protein